MASSFFNSFEKYEARILVERKLTTRAKPIRHVLWKLSMGTAINKPKNYHKNWFKENRHFGENR
jgi:hypothetical protein